MTVGGSLKAAPAAHSEVLIDKPPCGGVGTFSLVPDVVFDGAELGEPVDLAVDGSGRVFVLDKGFIEVQVYRADGSYDYSFGGEGSGPGAFIYPRAICVGSGERIYIADHARIQEFSSRGEYMAGAQHKLIGGLPQDLEYGENGNLYLLLYEVYDRQLIHVFDSSLQTLASFCDSYGVRVGADVDVREERYYSGGGISLGADGRILSTQKAPYRVSAFSLDGRELFAVTDEELSAIPRVTRDQKGITFNRVSGSVSVLGLPDGCFVNTVRYLDRRDGRESYVFELFDARGGLLACCASQRKVLPRATDREGRLYAIDLTEEPQIVRYLLER